MWYRDYTKYSPEALETNRKLAEERRNKMFAQVDAETSTEYYAGYSESGTSIILHKIIYVVLWLLSYGPVGAFTILYETSNENAFHMGVITVPMLVMFFVFAIYLFSQLRTGVYSNYFIYIHGIKRFRIISVIYAVLTSVTIAALFAFVFLSAPNTKTILLAAAFNVPSILAVWIIVVLKRLRKVRKAEI